jgi:hypothetical protein
MKKTEQNHPALTWLEYQYEKDSISLTPKLLNNESYIQESLLEWWGSLPFEAKEKIHHLELKECKSVEDFLNMCLSDWNEITNKQREDLFIEHHEKYTNITGNYDYLFYKITKNEY